MFRLGRIYLGLTTPTGFGNDAAIWGSCALPPWVSIIFSEVGMIDPNIIHHISSNPFDAKDMIERELCERSLREFLKKSWPSFDASTYISSWHLDAITEHLEAVAHGEIKRLLINIPPRHSKTASCSVAFPAWVWALAPDSRYPLIGPSAQFLSVAYGSEKAQEDGVTARRLIGSDWYQRHWGERVKIAPDRDNQERYDTTAGGSRISVGITASVLGRGGNIKIIDDASKPDEVETETGRRSVIRAYDETLSNRENNARIAAEIVIAQRLHENDLPGHILSKFGSDHDNGGFCHLCLPMEYDSRRHCSTVIGWQDPRGCGPDGEILSDEERALHDGEILCPERFTREKVEQYKKTGIYSYSSKYQQAPVPRGGGIIKPEWWMCWPPQGEEFDGHGKPRRPLAYPPFDYIVAALDTAYTSKQENDPSAMTLWGVFTDGGQLILDTRETLSGGREEDAGMHAEQPKIMLIHAWEARLELPELVMKVLMTCRKWNVDCLLIESKAAGMSAAQALQRAMFNERFVVKLENPRGDKDSRLHSVSHLFEQGLVYSPDRAWSEKVKDQASAGSKGQHDDLADTLSAALGYLRKSGFARTVTEYKRDVLDEQMWTGNEEPLYDV